MPIPTRSAKAFSPDLTRLETIVGWVYLPIHAVILPILLGLLMLLYPSGDLSEPSLNLIYYLIGLTVVVVFYRKLLRREFDHLCDAPLSFFYGFATGYLLWYALSSLATAIMLLLGAEETNPNNDYIAALSQQDYRLMMTVGVFFAPVLEEILFRGVVFQSIRKKNRLLAYMISIALFSVYHVWQYAVWDPSQLLFALQYIPITLAITWSYERSGTLWAPIALHMFNNYTAFALLQISG